MHQGTIETFENRERAFFFRQFFANFFFLDADQNIFPFKRQHPDSTITRMEKQTNKRINKNSK
jgi:hypothetical protein